MSQGGDPVRDFLRRSGAPYAVIAAGLRGLVANWERVVDLIAAGYPHGLDDYLNDMDGRQLLENALDVAPAELREEALVRVREADRRVRLYLVPAGRCLWGTIVAEEEGWDPERHWWYYERPAHPGPRLREELEGGPSRGG
ncbi:MAG TPA: hypothetical protein VNJ71_10850 [Gemmatimonadales bacterium]|nr:hypothetical protein [Gemmatimonadales bacterium]